MKRYLAYFISVMVHKYHVYVIGSKLGLGLFSILKHDLSKFSKAEFKAYAYGFYDGHGRETYIDSYELESAWLHHQHQNKHHWQAWVSYGDDGKIIPLRIPDQYVKEMIVDWIAFHAGDPSSKSADEYYDMIKDKIIIHDYSRQHLECLLDMYVRNRKK